MARIIRAKKRKSSGSKAAKVKTVTKRVYVQAKTKARRIRAAATERVSKKDIILAVAGAGVGSIGSSIVLTKIPESVPAVAKNGIVAAAGGVLAYYGIKKRNKALMGAGLGMAAVGAKGLISTAVPTLAAPRYNILHAPLARVPALNAPFTKTTLANPFVNDCARAIADEESI